ncbi:hypothetical protein [Streptomyces sp. SD31]|uniref:hypothetical protein n=1 Tax=Streptomyces sp. SD31 TaxID=3452208 RepID=UPI003F8C2AE0
MSMLRKLNSKIGATTGYQVRRVPAPPPTPLGGHVLRYEDLTADPAARLRDICAFLELG